MTASLAFCRRPMYLAPTAFTTLKDCQFSTKTNMKNNGIKSGEACDLATKISSLEAELAIKNKRIEELEFEKETNAELYSLAGVVSRAFGQNIGNIALRDSTLFDAARSLNAKQIWLMRKFSDSSRFQGFRELADIDSERKKSRAESRRSWLAALGIEASEDIFKVIVEYKYLLSRAPEAYRELFVPPSLFSEYFNAAIGALDGYSEPGKPVGELAKIEEKTKRAVAAMKSARESAISIIMGIFPDPETRSLIREFSEESAKDPDAGALANFIRQTRI